jgi:uncharacterized cupredoxin-like copper-binding protein
MHRVHASVLVLALAAIAAGISDAAAHGPSAIGRPAAASQAKRTIAVEMSDAMRYSPMEITVARGDVVRFEISNNGKLAHELVLGTMEDLKEHAEHMKAHPDMKHAEPNMIQLAAGKRGELVWQFTQRGEFHYGCLVPGHFEAGMVGKIVVK